MKITSVIKLFLAIIFMCFLSCNVSKLKQKKVPPLILNKGIGGNSTNDLLNRIEMDVLDEKPDLVILMVGTNDLLNSKKMISYEAYTSNLIEIVKIVKHNNIDVLLMSSPPVDSMYLFERHDSALFNETPNELMNQARKIVEGIANENNTLYVNIFDTFRSKGLPIHNKDAYIRNVKNSNAKDGVHPTALGYKLIAETVFQYLEKNELLNRYQKIICFGDSITKGSGAKGSGTITGENYPSYLNNMVINRINKRQ